LKGGAELFPKTSDYLTAWTDLTPHARCAVTIFV